MNVMTARKLFRETCENVFAQDKFKFFKKRDAFKCKKSAEVECLAHCRVINASRVLIEPSFSIRYLPIEIVFHEGLKSDKKFVDMTSVLWTGAKTIMNENKEVLFEVYAPEDAVSAAHRFVSIYKEFGKQFFETCSTLERIDSILNSEPLVFCPYQPSALHRCCFGSIAAILLHGREMAEEIIASHRDVISKEARGFYLSSFEAVINQNITQARAH